MCAAMVELLAGHPAAAERELRREHEVLERLGETYLRPTVAARLARVLCVLGRFDEAETFVRDAEETAAPDDVESQALWRSVRALLLAHRGRLDEAIELAAAAVGLLETTDGVLKQADALVVLSEVSAAAGRPPDAESAASAALSLYEAKGNEVAADRVRAALAELQAPAAQ